MKRIRFTTKVLALGAFVACTASPAQAQFVKLVTDFEGPFLGDVNGTNSEVIFRDPDFSGTTRGMDPLPALNPDSFWANVAGLGSFITPHSGTHVCLAAWGWEHTSDTSSWVRLVTSDTLNLPNPSLHLGGKVRVWIAAKAYSGVFSSPVTTGNLLVSMGVRETGVGAIQGGNGGTTGESVEWVGVTGKRVQIFAGTNGICDTPVNHDTDDIEINTVGVNVGINGICIDGGTNGIADTDELEDDETAVIPDGMFNLPSDGVSREYVFDLPALELSGNVIGFTGDGSLSATPNNRGTFDHLAFVNDAAVNSVVNARAWAISIDDVTFESPVIDPPRVIADPAPLPLASSVGVELVDIGDTVEVYRLLDAGGTELLGSAVAANSTVDVPTGPLAGGARVVARRISGPNTSDYSEPVVVSTPGNAPLRIAMAIRETDPIDNPLDCGDNGTGFDPIHPSTLEFIGATSTSQFGNPIGRRITPQADWRKIEFDPCVDPVFIFSGDGVLDINSTGTTKSVWEGLYFRIDEGTPRTGPYTVYIDDMMVENADGVGQDCVIDDFESYTPGEYIIEGDVNSGTGFGTAATVATGDDVQVTSMGGQTYLGKIIIGPGSNQVIDTEAADGEFIDRVHARFANPGVAGTSQGLGAEPDQSEVTDEQAFGGSQSLKVQWSYLNATNLSSLLRLTTNEALLTSGAPQPGAHQTFFNPDSVVNLTNAVCDNGIDVKFTFMMLMQPPAIPGDGDHDGDVDLRDYGFFQDCFGESAPFTPPCDEFDLAPNGSPDDTIDNADFELLNILLVRPL